MAQLYSSLNYLDSSECRRFVLYTHRNWAVFIYYYFFFIFSIFFLFIFFFFFFFFFFDYCLCSEYHYDLNIVILHWT